ncbi:hypothetical protein [Paenibacillus elgii]|uniref:hypothetical protein n=1 Tax=Paenibacillus elgii TaxID=189691 RepID=UPI000248DDBB|nr:hypothetical protein [Paenibacillus elgii]
MDIVADFANPLPVIVISEMLDVEQNDRALFKHLSDTMVKSPADASPESFERLYTEQLQARRELEAYFRQLIELRCSLPGTRRQQTCSATSYDCLRNEANCSLRFAETPNERLKTMIEETLPFY